MSVASEIQRLQTAKANIKSAIEGKGITVPSSTKLSGYANLIAQIDGSGGGGNQQIIDDDDMTDINKVYYIDHTGHIHYSYTLQEFLALQSEPANPSFTGLTPTGWQMSLTAAKAFVTANGYGPIIGQTYTTNDGTTRVYINIDEDFLKTFRVYYSGLSNANKTKLKIDWGDGSAQEQSNANAGSFVHTYAQQGEYVIKYIPEDSTVAYVPANSGSYNSIFGYYSDHTAFSLLNLITKIEYGGNVSGFLGHLLIKRCESITLPYGCCIGIPIGSSPEYVFSTSGAVTSQSQSGNLYNLSKLKSTILPEGLTTTSSFAYITTLNRVVLPSTLTTMPIFSYCKNLKAINIPTNITSLSNNTFNSCYSLTKIKFQGNLLTIGTGVFSKCYNLKEITLPNTITTINSNSFEFCQSLESITLPNSLEVLGASTFVNCFNLTGTITIPSNVTNIQNSTFQNCWNLKKIILPNTVTTFGTSVFNACYSLEEINIPTSLTTLGQSCFSGCYKLKGTINLPTGVTSIPNSCFANCFSITKVIIPNTVTSLGSSVFSACYSLEELVLPQSGITSIGASDFQNCYNLSGTINIPEGVTTIGASAFQNSIFKITEITIPSTVTSIGNYAFSSAFKTQVETTPNKIVHVKATTPPTAGTQIFSSIANLSSELTIYVPAASVNAYKTATNWKTYKDIIFAEPTT